MNKTLKIGLIVAGALIGGIVLLALGAFLGQRLAFRSAFNQGNNQTAWQNGDEAGLFCASRDANFLPNKGSSGQGKPGRFFEGTRSIGRGAKNRILDGFESFGQGRHTQFMVHTRTDRFAPAHGMMGARQNQATLQNQDLSMASAKTALESWLANSGNSDWELDEIMLFENNAYAVIIDETTQQPVQELLVLPGSLAVIPEYGPARMWNSQYGMMRAGRGMGARGGCAFTWAENAGVLSETEVSLDMTAAAAIAKDYLAKNLPDAQLVEEGLAFSGYYTFDYRQSGQLAGMLSVNASSNQVWLHTWHGQFIEEWEAD